MTTPRAARPSRPPVVSVIGFKDSGKTSVAVELVAALERRGRRVTVVKHGHGFDIDTPGTDSWRLRNEGGASRVVLAGPDEYVVMGEWGHEGEPALDEVVRRFVSDAEIVVVEGYKRAAVPKIEVYRPAAHVRPVFQADAEDAGLYLGSGNGRRRPRPADSGHGSERARSSGALGGPRREGPSELVSCPGHDPRPSHPTRSPDGPSRTPPSAGGTARTGAVVGRSPPGPARWRSWSRASGG